MVKDVRDVEMIPGIFSDDPCMTYGTNQLGRGYVAAAGSAGDYIFCFDFVEPQIKIVSQATAVALPQFYYNIP